MPVNEGLFFFIRQLSRNYENCKVQKFSRLLCKDVKMSKYKKINSFLKKCLEIVLEKFFKNNFTVSEVQFSQTTPSPPTSYTLKIM